MDKSGNYYQYNAGTHSYDQVNSATDMTVVTAGALSLTQVYGAGADILAKADAYTGNGTGYAVDGTNGALTLTYNSVYHRLSFSTDDGTFSKVGNVADAKSVGLNMSLFGGQFANINVDFSTCKNTNNGGKSTVTMSKGATDGTTGAGK